MPYVIIVGSRKYKYPKRVDSLVLSLLPDTTVISGGAGGVDSWAAGIARERGLACIEVFADWNRWGRYQAGFIRNSTMLSQYNGDVHVFHDGKSSGAKDTLQKAQLSGRRVYLYTNQDPVRVFDGEVEVTNDDEPTA